MTSDASPNERDPEAAVEPAPPDSAAADDQATGPDRPRDEMFKSGQPARTSLAGVALTIADAAGPVISAARGPIDSLTTGARRFIGERSGARVRRVRRMARQPLANLWDQHPEAHRASIRELGIQSVPVAQITGTAVEGAGQRGGDFLPLRDRRSQDWRARWQRIMKALDRLENLPPVELIKFGDGYWVVDGHNRVAAALYNGQVEIDAEVDDLRLPGMPNQPASRIVSVLGGSLDVRDAGAGRLTRTVERPLDLKSTRHQEHTGRDAERQE